MVEKLPLHQHTTTSIAIMADEQPPAAAPVAPVTGEKISKSECKFDVPIAPYATLVMPVSVN
jgi:hypothetical protein